MPRKKNFDNENLLNNEDDKNKINEEVDSCDIQEENLEDSESIEAEIKNETSDEAEIYDEINIPEEVDKVLKLVPDYEEVYVNHNGGIFTKDTKPELVEGAILYKNPYFEN